MTLIPAPPLPPFLEPELPFVRRALILERGVDRGRSIHLIDHGEPRNRPVLLQHGNPTWSFLWRRVIARLSGYRAVAPDLLGFGLSDRLPTVADHRLDRHAGVLVELVERLDLRGMILVGQDWGGPLVTSVGSRCPDRVAGLVLANTSIVVPRNPRGTWFHRLARIPMISELLFRGLGFPQRVLHRVQADRSSIRGPAARAYRWPLASWADRAGPLALARMVPDGLAHPSVPELRRGEAWARGFGGPVALVWGQRDPILGRALERHQRALPSARVIPTGAGHFLQEEVPEAVAEAIRWVDRAAPPA